MMGRIFRLPLFTSDYRIRRFSPLLFVISLEQRAFTCFCRVALAANPLAANLRLDTCTYNSVRAPYQKITETSGRQTH
jgi:hypothetical protein